LEIDKIGGKMKKIIRIVTVILLVAFCANSQTAYAAIKFKNIVGKYSFDRDLYYKKNQSSPIFDFGTQFRAFEPYLKITAKKKIKYYYSFDGGKGTCRLKKNILYTKMNGDNGIGKFKNKMKVKKIKEHLYIVDDLGEKTIYWRKNNDEKRKH